MVGDWHLRSISRVLWSELLLVSWTLLLEIQLPATSKCSFTGLEFLHMRTLEALKFWAMDCNGTTAPINKSGPHFRDTCPIRSWLISFSKLLRKEWYTDSDCKLKTSTDGDPSLMLKQLQQLEFQRKWRSPQQQLKEKMLLLTGLNLMMNRILSQTLEYSSEVQITNLLKSAIAMWQETSSVAPHRWLCCKILLIC